MTKAFSPEEFELLTIEARSQFEWARDEGDSNPEGIAFMVDSRVIGGRSRTGTDSAIANALSYLQEEFGGAAHNPIPSRILMIVTETRHPSEGFQADLKAAAGHPVMVTVLGQPGTKSLDFLVK